jgi:glutamyl-tRNA reductase
LFVVVGLSHRTAPLSVRERLALPRERLPELLARLLGQTQASEALVLSTCNRVEVYAACPTLQPGDPRRLATAANAVMQLLTSIGGSAVTPHLATAAGPDAVRHLFRVAASLDSLVVGEPQILGQLKDAIQVARASKALGPTLNHAMHRAVRVGKRVRTETQLGSGQVSVSSVAIDLARQIFSSLAGRTALLVGAGEMAEAAAKRLVKAGARLVLVNRSIERAQALATEVGGEVRPWDALERSVIEADIVVSSTSSPTFVLPIELLQRVRKARRGRSLFLIDIAVPRDIDPEANKLDGVFLYDLDDLSQIVANSLDGRQSEAVRAEAIVTEETRSFDAWALERALTPTITGMHARTRAVLAAEVERSLSGRLKHLADEDRAALAMMIDAATNKLLHAPVSHLRELAGEPRGADYAEALQALFDLPAPSESDLASKPQGPVTTRESDGASDEDRPNRAPRDDVSAHASAHGAPRDETPCSKPA